VYDPTSTVLHELTMFIAFDFRDGHYPMGLGYGGGRGTYFGFESQIYDVSGPDRVDLATGNGHDRRATLTGISSYEAGWRVWAARGDDYVHSIQIWQNDVAAAMTTISDHALSVSTGGSTGTIGGMIEYTGGPTVSDIGEILIFNRALSDDEVHFVNQYLYDKWVSSTPVPEPATLTLLGVCLAAVIARRRRQRRS
jgi:hypothetical protein